LHKGASGAFFDAWAVANNLYPLTVVFNIYNVACATREGNNLENLNLDIDGFGNLLSWVNLFNTGHAIRMAVVELRGGEFSLAASATNHGESPSWEGVLPSDV
jgi:hypothetical protein